MSRPSSAGGGGESVRIGLSAVIIAADEKEAYFLAAHRAGGASLPFGPFAPRSHRTFELGLREWVRQQTGFELGYVEQLYTFGDQGRELPSADMGATGDRGESALRVISVSYLALTPVRTPLDDENADWRDWRRHFPWEDWRAGRPAAIERTILPGLQAWAARGAGAAGWARARTAFGLEGAAWIEERALERYELLYEAGLAPEAARDHASGQGRPRSPFDPVASADLGEPMISDHRRILATAIGRLRAKIKYRPVIFELLAERFTLSHLQKVTEAIAGLALHKQNFRRHLERSGLVVGTGTFDPETGGRPAEWFRLDRERLGLGQALGLRVPPLRGE